MSSKYEALIVANLHKVSEGMVIKNYKELCNVFGMDIKSSGSSKKSQMKCISRFIKYKRIGNSINIIKVYEEPLELFDGRRGNVNHLSISHPDHYKFIVDDFGYDKGKIHSTGSYKLKWECSICSNHFIRSIHNICKGKTVRCTNCNSSSGEKLISKILTKLQLKQKREIKFKDLNGIGGRYLRFDFGIYDNNKLVCLIEYDGAFHDNLDRIKVHDTIKDKYCKDNNIPLLRIHHSVEWINIKMMIVRFVYGYIKLDNLKELIDIEDKVIEYKKYLDLLKNEMVTINNKISELENNIR